MFTSMLVIALTVSSCPD